MPRIARVVIVAAVAVLAMAPAAHAQLPGLPTVPGAPPLPPLPGGLSGTDTPVQPYGALDGGGFRDILPPGANGRYDAAQLVAFLATGATVPHCCDQLGMYRDLM